MILHSSPAMQQLLSTYLPTHPPHHASSLSYRRSLFQILSPKTIPKQPTPPSPPKRPMSGSTLLVPLLGITSPPGESMVSSRFGTSRRGALLECLEDM